MPALSVLFFFIIESSVLIGLVFHYKDMLESRDIDAKNPAILRFFFVTERTVERTQLNFSTFVVSRKIAIECGITFSEIHLFLENHSLEFHGI